MLLWFSTGMLACIPVLYILNQATAIPEIHWGIDWYLALLTLVFIPRLRGFILYVSATLIVVSTIILAGTNAALSDWIESWSLNLSLASLVLSVPLLGIPIRNRVYVETLRLFYVHYLRSVPVFYVTTTCFTHIMGVFLNLGAVSIFYDLCKTNPFVKTDRILGTALLRGFASVVTWSPFGMAVALITIQLHVEWIDIVSNMLGFVVLSIIISTALEWRLLVKEAKTGNAANANHAEPMLTDEERIFMRKGFLEIAVLLISLAISVFLINYIINIGMVVAICLASFLFPIAWMAFKRNTGQLVQEMRHYFQVTVPLMKKEVVLFLTAGFFSGAVAKTSFGLWFSLLLIETFGSLKIGILLFICFSFIVLSMVGFHPVLIVTIYLTMIDPATLGLSTLVYALLMLGSWAIVTSFSPLTAVGHLLSNLSGFKVTNLTVKWNLVYTLILVVTLVCYLEFLILFGGVI